MTKVENNKAWWLVLPVFLIVAFSAIIPLMTVVNYSVQDIFDPYTRYFVGTEWFKQVMLDERLHDALIRQFIFSFTILAIEIPLGIMVALMMPTKGKGASLALILVAIPLLIPWNVVGTIWQIFGRADIGLFGAMMAELGINYNYASEPMHAWLTVVLMDVWHWT
ncbi:MAG: sugar ABC transporter permease, partial [Pseudomonadota bacterium]|nr:sugar ABC transporter permease [Pseudomonadota bacterium]